MDRTLNTLRFVGTSCFKPNRSSSKFNLPWSEQYRTTWNWLNPKRISFVSRKLCISNFTTREYRKLEIQSATVDETSVILLKIDGIQKGFLSQELCISNDWIFLKVRNLIYLVWGKQFLEFSKNSDRQKFNLSRMIKLLERNLSPRCFNL